MAEPAKSKAEDHDGRVEPSRALRLWLGMLLSPAAAMVQLQTLWLASEHGCFTSDFTWNHVASIAALIVSAVGWAIAFGELRRSSAAERDDEFAAASRRRFMAMVGVMSGALFTALVFAMWLPTLLGVPCDK